MAQIHCSGLTLGYEGTTVLENLDLQIHQGDYLCILGENGTGKSTLMKAILGLHPLTSGSIALGDGLSPQEIGYLTQQSEIQRDFPASVTEIVRSGCQNQIGLRPFYSREEKKRAAAAMERLGISHLANRCYREMSGGQQQRVLLARALCATQKILFLDEPVTGLDAQVSREFYDIIEGLHREDGVTIVMISHDFDTSIQYATRILHLGSDTFCGDKADYLDWLTTRAGAQLGGDHCD